MPVGEEEIALARIDWAHQRQLAAVAIFLGLGIGIIELSSANVSDVGKGFFILLYIVLAGFLSYDLYAVFVFEREILRWQFRLIEYGLKVFKKNKWEIDFKESSFRFFFDYNNRDMPMRKNKVYTLPIVGFLLLMLLLLLKLCSVHAFPHAPLVVGFITCIVPLTFFVLIFTEVFDALFSSLNCEINGINTKSYVEGLYWGVYHLLRNLVKDQKQMEEAEKRFSA